MDEVVFDTEAAAKEQEALDFIEWMKTHNDNPRYVEQTKRWAVPEQRLDGKWVFPCCSEQDYTDKTVEEYDVAKHVLEEE